MRGHLRSNFWLLLLTLLLCSVLYPAFLWAVGRVAFRHKADGSLVTDPAGKPMGSRLIAQPFTGDEYFQPRPSAVSYNAAASGASNWAASNYLLRDRVARQLGPLVRYRSGSKKGEKVAPDVEEWFKAQPGLVVEWARQHPAVATAWANADDKHKEAVQAWIDTKPPAVQEWRKNNADREPKPGDLAPAFFEDWARTHPGEWPQGNGDPTWSVAGTFFDLWLSAHRAADLEPVPGDLVMASASGLDPHVTLKNARYQIDRVAAAWAKRIGADEARVRREIEKLLEEKAESPLGGLVGVPLVNVLEINQALSAGKGVLRSAKP
jgi:K+-transporting ATPase ATPase C chain